MEINFLKYFTLKRSLNIIKVLSSFYVSKVIRKPVVWGMPVSYSIEPTNLCNLKCPECPSGTGELTRKLGSLNISNFKKIIDQVYETGFYVQLYFQGEPYLNKELTEMIKYAQRKKMYVSISTNGHFINEKNIDKIIQYAPDKIIFSVDGLDEESYRNYRVGGSFKQVEDALKLLVQRKKEFNSEKPFLEFQFIVMKQNEHLLKDVLNYGKEIGVNKVVFKTMQVTSFKSALRFLPSDKRYSRYNISNDNYELKGKLKDHCFALWRTSVITWDGRVVPCCFDKDAKYELGKLNGKTFKDIWLSEDYMKFRKNILTNRKGKDICRNCTEGLKVNIMEIEN